MTDAGAQRAAARRTGSYSSAADAVVDHRSIPRRSGSAAAATQSSTGEADLGCLAVDELDALGGQAGGERGRRRLDLDLDERAVRRLCRRPSRAAAVPRRLTRWTGSASSSSLAMTTPSERRRRPRGVRPARLDASARAAPRAGGRRPRQARSGWPERRAGRRRPSRIAARAPRARAVLADHERAGRSSAAHADSRWRAIAQPKIGWRLRAVRKSPARPGRGVARPR